MPNPARSHVSPERPRSFRINDHWAVGALLLGLFVFYASLANNWMAQSPDSPEYLALSKSLATGQGYRDISDPNPQPHYFRPPGYPFFLIPAYWVGNDHSVMVAKLLTSLYGVLALLVLYGLMRRALSARISLFGLGIIGLNPVTAYIFSNVLSEPLYLLGSLAVLWFWTGDRLSDRKGWLFAAALAMSPLTRMIGLALTLAVFIDIAHRSDIPKRLRYAAIGSVPGLFFLLGMAAHPRQSHLGNFFPDPSGLAQGFFLQKTGQFLSNLFFYIKHLVAFVFPLGNPILSEDIVVRPVLAQGIPGLETIGWVVWIPGIILAAGCAIGLIITWDRIGRIATWYSGLYLAVICFYPMIEERLIFPLLPLLLFFGLQGLGWLLRRAVLPPFVGRILAITGLCLSLPLAVNAAGAAQENLRFLSDPEGLKKELLLRVPLPPDKFMTRWDLAGRWIQKHLRPDDILIGNKQVFTFSERKTRFTHLFPETLLSFNELVASYYPCYVAVPVDWGIPVNAPLFERNPLYEFQTVYDADGIRILKVVPHSTGTVRPEPPRYDAAVENLEKRYALFPNSEELKVRLGFMYYQNGDFEKAAGILEEAWKKPSVRNANLCRVIGDCYASTRKYEKALHWYQAGRNQPGYEFETEDLAFGIRLANLKKTFMEDELSAKPKYDALFRGLKYYEWSRENFKWGMFLYALESLEKAILLAPNEPEPYRLLGFTYETVGNPASAVRIYYRGATLGDPYCLENFKKLWVSQVVDAPEKKAQALMLPDGSSRVAIPFEGRTYEDLGRLYFLNGQYPIAVQYLKKGLAVEPGYGGLYQALGMSYEALGDLNAALEAYKSGLEKSPKNKFFAERIRALKGKVRVAS